MAETKYGKNIVTEVIRKKEAPWTPKFGPEDMIPMMFIDSRVMEGAFYVESAWMLPGFARETRGTSHTHDYDEVLGFYGSNPKDPLNLNALAEVHIGGEVHTVTRSCLIFIPKGVPHGPIDFKRIDAPIFHFSCGTSSKYF